MSDFTPSSTHAKHGRIQPFGLSCLAACALAFGWPTPARAAGDETGPTAPAAAVTPPNLLQAPPVARPDQPDAGPTQPEVGVELELTIDADGTVGNARVAQPATEGEDGAFADAAIDALLVRVRETSDDDARHALDRQLHRALYEAQPYLFLSSSSVDSIVRRQVHGIAPTPLGFDFRGAYFSP